jgi:hypothetical protein
LSGASLSESSGGGTCSSGLVCEREPGDATLEASDARFPNSSLGLREAAFCSAPLKLNFDNRLLILGLSLLLHLGLAALLLGLGRVSLGLLRERKLTTGLWYDDACFVLPLGLTSIGRTGEGGSAGPDTSLFG